MNKSIDNLLNNMDLSEQDISYYKNQYKIIQEDFINKRFKFNRLKSDSQYINVLKEYLKYNGYGYLFKTISYLSSDGKVDSIKLAKRLIDSNLIHKPNIKFNSKIKNKEIINYKKEFGIIEKLQVNYATYDFPFKINDIDYGNKDYINCEITASNSITIGINIKKYQELNFTEVLVIYTSYGVDKLEFSIKCDKSLKSLINLKNFDEFIELCKVDYDKAFAIFKKERFREWLEKKRYVTQVINYDQALSIEKIVDNKSFEKFCAFNETYPIKYSEDISEKDKEREIVEIKLDGVKEKDIKLPDNTGSTRNGEGEAITEGTEENVGIMQSIVNCIFSATISFKVVTVEIVNRIIKHIKDSL